MAIPTQTVEYFQAGLVDLCAELARPATLEEIATYFGWDLDAVRAFLDHHDWRTLGIDLSCIEGPGAHNPVVGVIVGSRPLPRYSPTPELVRYVQAARPATATVYKLLMSAAAQCDIEAAALTERAMQYRAAASCSHRWIRLEQSAGHVCLKCGTRCQQPCPD